MSLYHGRVVNKDLILAHWKTTRTTLKNSVDTSRWLQTKCIENEIPTTINLERLVTSLNNQSLFSHKGNIQARPSFPEEIEI